MNRKLLILALASLLAACTNQGAEPTASGSGGAPSASAAGSGGAAGEPSAACADAFAPLADMELESVSDLGDLQDEVTTTIQDCESVADWIAGASQVVENDVRPGAAELLLRIRCEAPELADAPICDEL